MVKAREAVDALKSQKNTKKQQPALSHNESAGFFMSSALER
jgi:hypothetical protein